MTAGTVAMPDARERPERLRSNVAIDATTLLQLRHYIEQQLISRRVVGIFDGNTSQRLGGLRHICHRVYAGSHFGRRKLYTADRTGISGSRQHFGRRHDAPYEVRPTLSHETDGPIL